MRASQAPPTSHDHQFWIQQSNLEIRIFCTRRLPISGKFMGTVLLIHGLPETSYQSRHVIVPLAAAGSHVLTPDYRGHGYSSKSPSGYTMAVLSQDLHELVTEQVGIRNKIHIVGQDIGGITTHAYAAQFPEHVASINWGECPLPGETFQDDAKHTAPLWHFNFRTQRDIAVALVTAKEKVYLKQSYDRLG